MLCYLHIFSCPKLGIYFRYSVACKLVDSWQKLINKSITVQIEPHY